MKTKTSIFTGLILLGLGVGPVAAEPKAVVELFTSQGCSSCPPADKFVGDLVNRDDIIALSMPVDYWDYLGWKDTFGRKEHTERQYSYARARGDRRVYTPQIIVNGGDHYVGSARSSVERAVAAQKLTVPVDVAVKDGELMIKVGASSDGKGYATIRLVTFSPSETVDIGRGENTGRTITYSNVVRDIRPVGMWKGGETVITLPLEEIMLDGAAGCAVLVQTDTKNGPGQIVGAAKWQRPTS